MKRFLTMFVFVFVLLPIVPSPAFAITKEDILDDTVCREKFPWGQGELTGPFLYKVRRCVNERKRARAISAAMEKSEARMVLKNDREGQRRQAVLDRVKRGFQMRRERKADVHMLNFSKITKKSDVKIQSRRSIRQQASED